MNAKTAKLINRYAKAFNENARDIKRFWYASDDQQRFESRTLYKAELEAQKFLYNQ